MIDTTRVEQNPGQRTLPSHLSVLHPLDRTIDTPSLPVESRRRPRVVPTATTRCGNRPSPLLSLSSPFHSRANTTLDPQPSTRQILSQTSPMIKSVATRRVSPSYPTQPPSPHFLALRWRNSLSWNVRRRSDVRNTSCFTPRLSVGPNARLQCGFP